ncbi:MAG TPA: hypothetical protein VF156_15520 [Agromyces sp.]
MLEVKRPMKASKPTPGQLAELARWHRGGAAVAIVRSVDAVRLLVNAIREDIAGTGPGPMVFVGLDAEVVPGGVEISFGES